MIRKDTKMLFVNFLKHLVITTIFTTIWQIVNIFGIFLLFGLVLYLLAKWTENCARYSHTILLHIFVTGWIGIPVHEIGHAVFALLFGHKILEIKLFSPDFMTGTMGYVRHSWNRKNIYHRIGNFFIGAGPIILGGALIAGLAFLLLPHARQSFYPSFWVQMNFTDIPIFLVQMKIVGLTGLDLVKSIFLNTNYSRFAFWVFLYLTLCISSHMELSPSDLKTMIDGFFVIVLIMLIVNLVIVVFGFNVDKYVYMMTQHNGIIAGIFFLAVIISLCNFIFTFIMTSIFSMMFFKKVFNPFI
ncbi:hypothetical protein JXA84_05005 [candidate division WOR-3 bacterium]|nr:hypothetical protein [candidate division WOR-3 bacterium]